MSRLRAAVLGSVLLAAACGPAAAGPRVTLRLENTTLHQVFRKLQNATGIQLRSQDGAGEPGYRDPTTARRTTVDWKNATMGRVVRDLCGSFGLTASPMGDGGYWFRPGALPRRGEVLVDGVAFSVGGISQQESISLTPGQPQPRVARSVSLRLVCRAEDGDGDIIGPLTRLAIVDDRGRSYEPRLATPGNEYAFGLPDERFRNISIMPWTGEHPGRFRRIEGELTVFERAEEQRFVIPVPAKDVPLEQQQGPLRLALRRARAAGRRLEAQFRLKWPAGVNVALSGGSAVRIFTRLEDGRMERVYSGYNVTSGDGADREVDYAFTVEYDTPVTAVEVAVPLQSGPQRKVAFRLENVITPWGRPPKFRMQPLNLKPRPAPAARRSRTGGLPESYFSLQGGTLVLPPYAQARQDGSLAAQVSLSRRRANGTWDPPRWVQLDTQSDSLRLENLTPGAYRVKVTLWERKPDGSLRRLPAGDRAAEVRILKGTETKL